MKKISFIVFLLIITIFLNSQVFGLINKDDSKLYYSFDNSNITGSNPLDLTGNIGTGTTTGATTGATGIINEAFLYDGDGDYVQTPAFTDSLTNTYCVWFNSSSISGERNTILSKRPTSTDRDWQMTISGTTNKIEVIYYNGASTFAGDLISSTIILNNNNYFVCLTRDGNNIELFVNGNSEDTDSTIGKGRENKLLQIGLYNGATGGDNSMNGIIDELSYFDIILNNNQIEELYNSGLGLQYPYIISTTSFIQNNLTDFYNKENISITLNTTSNVNMSYILDSGLETSICNNCNFSILNLSNLTEIEHNIIFISKEENGQVNTSDSFTVDLTKPVITQIKNVSENTFDVNFSEILNVTDNLSGINTCFINITEAENVLNPDNFYINCSDTQTFISAGLHNATVTATDNAGNKQTYFFDFTIIPYVFLFFQDEDSIEISNYDIKILHPDGRIITLTNTSNPINLSPVNDGVLDLGTHFITFSKNGYTTTTFEVDINETSNTNITFTTKFARILLYIRDQDTGNLITGTTFEVEFIATVGLNTTTSTGLVNITNTFFENEEYFVVITNPDYQTETLTFYFTNREIIEIDAYMISNNDTNLGVIFIKPIDNFGKSIVAAQVKALQWDSSTSSYTEVSSAITGSDGLGRLNVILNEKVYIFRAISGGISAELEPQIIDSTQNGATIEIQLRGLAQEYSYLLENVRANATQVYNNITNTSTVTFNYDSSIGNINICINQYRIIRGTESLVQENCILDDSGAYILDLFINNSYLTIIKAQIIIDGVYYTINSFEFQPRDSFSNVMRDLGLAPFIVPLLFLLAIALGMFIENVYIGTFALIVMGGLSLTLAPTILTKGIVAFFFFVGWVTINMGVKSR